MKALLLASAVLLAGSGCASTGVRLQSYDGKAGDRDLRSLLARKAPTEPVTGATWCKPEDINRPTCTVVITPSDNCAPNDKKQVDPEILGVKAKRGFRSPLSFELKSGTWALPKADAITFGRESPQLACGPVSETQWHCDNVVNNSNYYEYSIKLVRKDGGPGECVIDPGVFNSPQS